ncbi:uncharacterized protein LOC128883232 [Hylaeus volcanicus]|uniref:uncharacterized protein LOC128883232 n=1 Tax=Hylaeus volcanicus TaxID=313075 RepID=UPI0023B84531|nr:uncharacterized protein LOC128883232 [Hylaeus volcanicus]XP_053991347.1 uncharacterized protein LOC128883232 [Hylaeus volcanicus]XP_053991348.1 uncharacterized protein LOC128883232 [Hylaeus volcanicus]
MSQLNGVNVLGFGTWKLPANSSTSDLIYKIICEGYRHIDCASIYGNEKYVGEGIQRALREGIVKREELWITSKLWNTDHAEQHVEPAIQRSLKLLNLTYLDLYLIHFPIAQAYVCPDFNPTPGFVNRDGNKTELAAIPLMETWRALENLVHKKLTRFIGISNFDLQLTQDLLTYCKIRPYLLQIEMHLFLKQETLAGWCLQNHIHVTAYSPLGSASYSDDSQEEYTIMTHPVVLNVAKQMKMTPAQVALKWILQKSPLLSVLVKTSNLERAQENLKSLSFSLTPEAVEELNSINYKKRYNDTSNYTLKSGWLPIFCDV